MIELGKSYDCGGCIALCCRKGVRMELTPAEAEFMEAGGTELQELRAPVEVRTKRIAFLPLITREFAAVDGQYELMTDCGYLTTDTERGQKICSAYEDPSRPAVCGDFKAGDYGCMTMRVMQGVDEMDEYELFLQQTAGG